MRYDTRQANRRWTTHLATVLIAFTTLIALFGARGPTPAQARKYGHRYNYGAIIKRCQSHCGAKSGVINACRARAKHAGIKSCSAAYRSERGLCAGDVACQQTAKQTLKLCARTATQSIQADRKATKAPAGFVGCNRCCRRTRGQSGCLNYFQPSRFYGAYKYHGRLGGCVDQPGPGGSTRGAFVAPQASARIRQQIARLIPSLVDGWAN